MLNEPVILPVVTRSVTPHGACSRTAIAANKGYRYLTDGLCSFVCRRSRPDAHPDVYRQDLPSKESDDLGLILAH